MNSIRSAPARPFRCTTPSFRRSTSDRIRFINGVYSGFARLLFAANVSGQPLFGESA